MPALTTSHGSGAPHPWVSLSDEALLEYRLCDLGLRTEGTALERRVDRLYDELLRAGLRFRPYVWLSTDWFTPDGHTGFAVPFYLAHPRLTRLELRRMLEVEGGTETSCMRVLRHEAGHALDTAYRLHFKKDWRETFGSYSRPYPELYRPKPGSRRFVLHLEGWYAQAHPAEDFAETFAVWLKPRSTWRRRYREWPVALRKLEYVDGLMREISGSAPRVRSRARLEPVSQLTMTLGEYYSKKTQRYGVNWSDAYDRDLERLFSSDPRYLSRPSAAAYLRGIRGEIRETVAEWTGTHSYTIDQVLQEMIERCRELRMRLKLSPRRAKTQAILLLTVHTMNCLHASRQEIPL